jgi:hypothetical protein
LPDNPVERRWLVYDGLTPVLKRFNVDVSVIEMDAKEIGRAVSHLLLNIAHDGAILYDKSGRLTAFFKSLREAVSRAGLTRYKTRNGKYGWKPSKEPRPGEILRVKLGEV